MRVIKLFLVCILFSGCNKHLINPLLGVYDSNCKKQVVFLQDAIEGKDEAVMVGKLYLSLIFSIDQANMEVFKVELVNEDVWRLGVDLINEKSKDYHYYIYLKKKDGAVLYVNRESPHFRGAQKKLDREARKKLNIK